MTTMSTILVADDDLKVRTVERTVLTEVGFNVVEAVNGRDALRIAREHLPDVVLLDIVMPDLTGIEVCRELKEDKRTRKIPVIIVSGLDAREALEHSIIAGADDFLSKPIDSLELLVRVRSMLRVRNIRDDSKRLTSYIQHLQESRRARR